MNTKQPVQISFICHSAEERQKALRGYQRSLKAKRLEELLVAEGAATDELAEE